MQDQRRAPVPGRKVAAPACGRESGRRVAAGRSPVSSCAGRLSGERGYGGGSGWSGDAEERRTSWDRGGTPGWDRTSGFQLRRLTLYPLSYGRVRGLIDKPGRLVKRENGFVILYPLSAERREVPVFQGGTWPRPRHRGSRRRRWRHWRRHVPWRTAPPPQHRGSR